MENTILRGASWVIETLAFPLPATQKEKTPARGSPSDWRLLF